MENGYVAAGGFSIYSSILKKIGNEPEKIGVVEKLIMNSSNRVLHSFGSNLNKKKKFNSSNYVETFVNGLNALKDKNSVTKKLKVYIDSGGFQCAMGYLTKNEMKSFVDCYYDFLNNNSTLYDYAFSLDLPPADSLYNSWDDMYDYNYYSYKKLFVESSDEVRKKLLFVKQFRTPSQYYVWNKILNDKDIINSFTSNYWSIGGIVANLGGESAIPYITYCIPFSDIFQWCKNNGKTNIAIHILGGCSYRDLFFYSLVKRYMKLKYNFEVNFTYDSSGLIKQILMGRFINIITEDNTILKLSFLSRLINEKIGSHKTVKETLMDSFTRMFNYYNITPLLPDSIYKGDKLNPYAELLLTIYQLFIFDYLKNDYDSFVNNMSLDQFEHEDTFNSIIYDKLLKINGGKLSIKYKNKANNFYRSIQHLNIYDSNKNKELIDHYMAKDEIKFGIGQEMETF